MARQEQLQRVSNARTQLQTTMLDNGKLHKQWRTGAWEERRNIKTSHKLRNQASATKVRAERESVFKTTEERKKQLQQLTLERYESDRDSLSQLTLKVQEHSDYLTRHEMKVRENMSQTR